MKSLSFPSKGSLRIGCFALSVVVAGVLRGAENPLPPPATVGLAQPSGRAAQQLLIIDGKLDRPEGKVEATLATVVDALRDQYPDANIVFSPGLAQVKIGDLKLRATGLAEELEAVRIASGEKFDVQPPSGPVPIDPNTGSPLAGARRVNAGLFVLRPAEPTAQNRRMVGAFNIGPYLDWMRRKALEEKANPDPQALQDIATSEAIGTIKEIISQTLKEFNGDAAAAGAVSFQYHSGATLLIVIGTSDSVEIARKIINVLPGMSSIAEESRSRFGLESEADRSARQRAEDAARYGLAPRTATPAQPGPAPNADSAK